MIGLVGWQKLVKFFFFFFFPEASEAGGVDKVPTATLVVHVIRFAPDVVSHGMIAVSGHFVCAAPETAIST